MLPEPPAGFVDHVAATPTPAARLHQRRGITEAKILAVALGGDRQIERGGSSAHLGLGQIAEREERVAQVKES